MTSKLKTLSGTNFRYECAEGNYFPKGKNSALKGSVGTTTTTATTTTTTAAAATAAATTTTTTTTATHASKYLARHDGYVYHYRFDCRLHCHADHQRQ